MPSGGIPEVDCLVTVSVRTLILIQKRVIQATGQENVEPSYQLTALATELASLREPTGRSFRSSSSPPSSDGRGFCCTESISATRHRNVAKLVAASAVDKQAILDSHLVCCCPSWWMRWLSITTMPVAEAHCCRDWGVDPDPLPHLLIEIALIKPLVILHWLLLLV